MIGANQFKKIKKLLNKHSSGAFCWRLRPGFLFATQTEDTHALRLKSKLGFLEVQERNRRIVVLCRSVHSLRALLACRAASIIAALGCQPGEKTLINRF